MAMGNPLKAIGEWLVSAMTDKIIAPISDMRKEISDLTEAQASLADKVEEKRNSFLDGA